MHSLRNHLILQVFLPLALLTAGLVWAMFATVEGTVESRMEKEIEMVARTLRIPVERALNDGDTARVSEALRVVTSIGEVYGAYVYDATGRRIDMAGDVVPGYREQLQAQELVVIGEETGLYEDVAGAAVYSYFVPLMGHIGQISGLLQITREESDFAIRLRQVRQFGVASLVLVLGTMFGILILTHRRAVVRPIEHLLQDMRRVEQGDRGWRAAVQGPRELAALAGGLNRMLDARQLAETELGERRRAELEMNEQLRVQEKDAALGRFSAGLVHELGAPLTVIDSDARRLAGAHQDEDSQRRLSRVRTQINRTRRLIQQLMNFVREERRVAERISVQSLIDQTLAGARPEADSRGIGLQVVNPHPGWTITGYRVRLEHALLNLVRNAVQAAAHQVCVTVTGEHGRIEIAVEDDGPGIAPADREKIFEPFLSYRADGTGTGLGLAIVNSVVKEHGGQIRVDSSDRLGGSRFIMELSQS